MCLFAKFGIYCSLPCCFGEIPTKYHITIQKTITPIKAAVKVVSENRSRFEKFTMPWNAAQKSNEWVSVATFPIPHEAKSRSRKKGNTLREVKSKCHKNHIPVMISIYCQTGNFLSSYCKKPRQPNSSNSPYANANKHVKPKSHPPIMPKTIHGITIVAMDFQADLPKIVYSVLRLKMSIATNAPTAGPSPVASAAETWSA